MAIFSFILHDYKTGEEISVTPIDFRSEGIVGQTGTYIWWKDINLNPNHAKVKETPEEIGIIMGTSKS